VFILPAKDFMVTYIKDFVNIDSRTSDIVRDSTRDVTLQMRLMRAQANAQKELNFKVGY